MKEPSDHSEFDESEEDIRAANDHFFQGFYGIADASRGFLEPTILRALSEQLDWDESKMELIRGLFVDPRLHFTSSDLLWKVPTKNGEDLFVLVSFDHQTRPDKWMALRSLLIQTLAQFRILSEDEGHPKRKLPVIYCVVLYQGVEPWNAPLEYQDLVNWDAFPRESGEAISDYVPKFRYQVVPLQTTPDEDLPRHHLTRLGLTLMRAAILHELADWVRENRGAISVVLQRGDGESILTLMFNYAAQKVRGKDELNELNQAIDTLDESSKHIVMNGAQILREEGKAEGIAEGKTEGMINTVHRMLERGYDPETIADVHDVPVELIVNLADGQEPDLSAWVKATKPSEK